MVAIMTSSSRQLRTTLALLAVRKSQWPFERLARELGVDVSLVKFCWRTLLAHAWRLYPYHARSKTPHWHWQPDPSVKAMIALAAYRVARSGPGDRSTVRGQSTGRVTLAPYSGAPG